MIFSFLNRKMKTSTLSIVAIVAIAGLLIAASLGTTQASAYKHRHHHHHHHDGQSARASISQENNQRAVCISGSSTTGSCNQDATNVNTGNAVAANVR
jgi:hypothetical protein